MDQVSWKLVAPDMDRLLNCFGERWKNPSAQTPAVLEALDGLFDTLADLEPLERNEEAKKAWGYYFVVAGKAWNRSVEAASFYVALKRAGMPVALREQRGEDRVLFGIAIGGAADCFEHVDEGVLAPVAANGMVPGRVVSGFVESAFDKRYLRHRRHRASLQFYVNSTEYYLTITLCYRTIEFTSKFK